MCELDHRRKNKQTKKKKKQTLALKWPTWVWRGTEPLIASICHLKPPEEFLMMSITHLNIIIVDAAASSAASPDGSGSNDVFQHSVWMQDPSFHPSLRYPTFVPGH